MAKYFVKPNEDFPDSAHRFWLRKDQYTIGELFVDEDTANWIAAQLQCAADGARFCPECHALLEEHSVYCDTCGTDTPRR